MSRFAVTKKQSTKTTNYEGAEAYSLTPKLALYSAVCCASLQRKFYAPNCMDEVKRIRGLVEKVDPEFTAKLAVYARTKMYLRSVPLILVVELAKIGKLRKELIPAVIQRVDEITEVLAYYQSFRKGTKKLNKVANALLKGIKAVFESDKFDAYQYAKYNRDTDPTIRDAVFLSHPKPTECTKMIVEESLPTPKTWETTLSAGGDKTKSWETLIVEKKLGYMATLRNLRNMLQAGIGPLAVEAVCDYLQHPEAVKRSRQFPFRFWSAYHMLAQLAGQAIAVEKEGPWTEEGEKAKNINKAHLEQMMEAVNKAIELSCDNIAGFSKEDRVVVAGDVSGSMTSCKISPKSIIDYKDVALILGTLFAKHNPGSMIGLFGQSYRMGEMDNKGFSVLEAVHQLRKIDVGHSTNGYLIFKHLWHNKDKVDKVLIFTDCQLWDDSGYYYGYGRKEEDTIKGWFAKYQKDINPDCKLYLFDLAGYGTTPISFSHPGVAFIAGWSDKIFDMLWAVEQGGDAVKEIEKIEI